jgi:hypothetical protein
MGKRIDRTIKNWRWWVGFPVIVVMLPVALIDCVLSALVTTGEVANECQWWIRRKVSPAFRWLRTRPTPEAKERT